MLNKLKYYFKLSRPRFWLYLAGTYLIGYSAAISNLVQYFKPLFWFNFLYFLIPANLFLYGINDYFDHDTDQFNQKKGDKEVLLQNAQKKSLKLILTIIFLISLILVLFQTNLINSLLLIIFLFLAYFYSATPLRFKAHPILDFLSNSLYIVPGIVGYYQINTIPINYSLIMSAFFWAFAMHLFSAIPDISADNQAKIQTSAVYFGKRLSLIICIIFWSIFSYCIIKSTTFFPYSLLSLIYPFIPLFILLNSKLNISKIYWLYPYLNAIIGFIAFILIIQTKI